MKKRLVFLIAAIGMLLPLVASSQRVQPVQQLAVYDADGKRVAPVSAIGNIYGRNVPEVVLKLDDVLISLLVFRDGFLAMGSRVVWESTNCTGTPFLLSVQGPKSSLPLSGLGLPGNTVYGLNGPAQTIAVRSYSEEAATWQRGGAPPQFTCTSWGPFTIDPPVLTYPAKPVVDLTVLFKPPFSVR